MAITAANLQVNVGANTRDAERGLARVSSRLSGTQDRMKRVGRGMTKVGGALTAGVTLPLLAVGGAATKMAADFESEMAKITGLVGQSEKQVARYKEEILGLAGDVGKAPKELAEAMFFITSAGLEGEEALDALRQSAMASTAGLGETKQVANAVTNAMNAYGSEVLSASQATDILTATVREGKAEASELGPQFGRVLPFAAELGVKFDQIGASLAFFTRTTGDAAKAGTFLEGILRALVKPTAQGREALEKVGTSYERVREIIAEQGLMHALTDLRDRFGENSDEMAKVFADGNALAGVLQLTGDQAGIAKDVFASLADSAGSTQQAFDKASETANVKLQKAIAGLKATLTDLGGSLLPHVTSALETLSGWLEKAGNWWGNLSSRGQTATLVIAGIAAAIGPVIAILGGLALAIAALMTPVGLVVAAIAGAVAGLVALGAALVVAYKKSETFRNIVNAAFEAVKVAVTTAIDAAKVAVTVALNAMRAAASVFVSWATAIWDRWGEDITRIATRAWSIISDIVERVLDFVVVVIDARIKTAKNVIAAVTAAIRRLWDRWGDEIMKILARTWENVKLIVAGAMDVLLGIIDSVLALIQGDWSGAWEGMKQAALGFVQIIVGIVDQFMNTIGRFVRQQMEELRSFWESIWQAISDWVGEKIEEVVGFVSGIGRDLRSAFAEAWGQFVSFWERKFGDAKDWVGGIVDDVVDFFANLPDRIWEKIKGVGALIKRAFSFDLSVGGEAGGPGDGAMPPGGSVINRLTSFMASTGIGHRVTSTFRPGDDGYHGQARAVDFAGPTPGFDTPQLRAIQRAWVPLAASGTLKELIGPDPSLNFKNGRQYPYSPGVQQGHKNHVHTAMANGGLITEPIFGIGSSGKTYSFGERGPERVTPGRGHDGAAIVVPVYLDGREIARATVDDVRDQLSRLGRQGEGLRA